MVGHALACPKSEPVSKPVVAISGCDGGTPRLDLFSQLPRERRIPKSCFSLRLVKSFSCGRWYDKSKTNLTQSREAR